MASEIIEFDVDFNYADQEEGIEIPLALNANRVWPDSAVCRIEL